MINELTSQIAPLVEKLAERYKKQDIVKSLLDLAFQYHAKTEKDKGQALNTFRALSENAVRSYNW
jgi:hypothetical protein